MGNTSSSQVAQSIATSISNIAMNATQSASTTNSSVNIINANCSSGNYDSVSGCSDTIKTICGSEPLLCENGHNETIMAFVGLCEIKANQCKVSNVSQSNKIVALVDNTTTADLTATVKNSITANLNQSIKNTSAQQTINSSINQITSTIVSSLQSMVTKNSSVNVIKADGYNVYAVSQTNFTNAVVKNLLKDIASAKAINTAAVTIAQSAEGTYNWIIYIGAILITIFIIIFLILMLAKSDNVKQFFHRILPFLVWFVMIVITTLVFIIFKLPLVSSINAVSNKKEINLSKLILWLSVFYVGYGIILYIFFKIKRRKENN
jgi:hypothetical protein